MNKTKRKNHRYHKKRLRGRITNEMRRRYLRNLRRVNLPKKVQRGVTSPIMTKKMMVQVRKNATDIINDLKKEETAEKQNEASSQTQTNVLDMTVAVNTQPMN